MPLNDSNQAIVKHDGFSIVELTITLGIVLLIAGALAAAVGPARQAFDRVPADLDLQQRARTALEAIAQPFRSALSIEVVDAATLRLTIRDPDAAADSTAVDQLTFHLAQQADGSYTLIRETRAGAIQPIVDFVSDLSFVLSGGRLDVSIRVHSTTDSLIAPVDFRTSIAVRNET